MTKATTLQQQQQQQPIGPTNPIVVGTASKITTSTTSLSRIPRLNMSSSTQHRVGANVGPSPDSSGTMDHNDSSLDLSQIGRNRSTSSSQSSNSSLVSTKPSRLLPPGSIVSAKLAAHQVGRSRFVQQQQQPSVRATTTTSTPVSVLHKPTTIKSKLPVATSSNIVSKRPECRSTRSLPEGSMRTRVTRATTTSRSINQQQQQQQQQPNNGRIKNVVLRSVVVSSTPKSVLRIPHKTPCMTTTSDRGSVSKKKANNNNNTIAGGIQPKEDEGGLECRPVSARGGGEICRGSQGRLEGYFPLSDPRITPPPPPPPPPPPALLPDESHLGNVTDDSLLSQSAKSEESSGALNASVTGLISSNFHLNVLQSSHGTVEHQQTSTAVVIRQSELFMARPVSCHESSQEWTTVRINIPAAESSELLPRLECERRSIRGSTHYMDGAPSVAADVELMELLERDILITGDEQQQQPTPDESVENPQRSLSLPKSFLATKYGLIGLKAALPR